MRPHCAATRRNRTRGATIISLLLATILFATSRDLGAQEAVSATALQWTPATLFPPGALLAVASGDPASPGQTIAQLFLPDGYIMPPHLHPMDVRLKVRQGMLLVGMGDRLDVHNATVLRTGDSAQAPAGTHHSWIARGATIVSLTFDGPYTITYVNAYQAPKPVSFPYVF
jgi:quercetin dioxygenase-like cupin family protein